MVAVSLTFSLIGFLMISGGKEVNLSARIRLISAAKLGDIP